MKNAKLSSQPPFFSVVVPTVGRHKLLNDAIQSVLWQSFSDFELIVSDNSDNAETKLLVDRYLSDKRIRYIKPEFFMGMPDHWEFASRHAAGKYVLTLTDRLVMRPSALAFLHHSISQFSAPIEAVCWFDQTSYDDKSGVLLTGEFTTSVKLENSKEVIQAFAQYQMPAARIPHSLNSCYSAETAEQIRTEQGRLFIPVSPDFTSAYLLLAYTENVLYLDIPLYVGHGDQRLSTGSTSLSQGLCSYTSSFGNPDAFARVPLRLDTLANSIIDDLLTVQELVGNRLSDVDLNIEKYLLANYKEILNKEKIGALVNTASLYSKWWEFVKRLPEDKQRWLTQQIRTLHKQYQCHLGSIRRLCNRLGIKPLLTTIRAKSRRLRNIIAGRPVYDSVLDAASRTNHWLTLEN